LCMGGGGGGWDGVEWVLELSGDRRWSGGIVLHPCR